MGSTFIVRPVGQCTLGATTGGALGLALVLAAAVLLAPTGGEAASLVILAVATLLLAVPLGWLFAPRALAPGMLNALGAAAGITAVAVPLGAVVVGLGMVAGRAGDLAPGEMLGGLLFVVVGGLFLFGLPLACATFVVAGVWVVLVRAAAPVAGVVAPTNPWADDRQAGSARRRANR